MRRVPLLLAATFVAAAGGYAVADAYDRVPGILTLKPPAPVPSGSPAPGVRPLVSAPPDPAQAPVPTSDGLAAALREVLADPRLGTSISVSVRDGVTGTELYAVGTRTPRTPASLVKLLAATAVLRSMPGDEVLKTSAVLSGTSQDLYLIAGGDVLLAAGAGSPGQVRGRAGLADLAQGVADFLRTQGLTQSLRVHLGDPFPGKERTPPGWRPEDFSSGSALPVAMIGLADDRPDPGTPGVSDPERRALEAFVKALVEAGVPATPAPGKTRRDVPSEQSGAVEVASVESAPVLDLVSEALLDSDNPMTETLVRVAAHSAKVEMASTADVPRFVTQALARAKIPTAGLQLLDASGLSRGQRASVETISATLAAALDTQAAPSSELLARLPVAGYSGTLKKRFLGPDGSGVAGVPRAKTGTLSGASNMAGWTVSADGRPLLFTIIADGVSPAGTDPARAALDRFAAVLTGCGCR
ncbi:MAG: D-alanyl-D-alanine carboxypeptidase/D-alanyl-D-alanine-endopeptidase [Tetrasphaera sp.]|nr:D-alanyl-D-alanine carboxypeptidase/D-alanyl-D-alanine-endopeptidase [Tetrasphaera sp.]